MRGSDVLGIVFPNTHDKLLRELTGYRAMGSVPFGSRYRIIDFTLSNLVNAGISKTAIVTKSNYQSLMDHLGSGKSWDLARKNGGLYILPPFGRGTLGVFRGNIDALNGIMQFLTGTTQKYVVLTNADIVCNLDIAEIVDTHIKRNADVTIVTKNGIRPKGEDDLMVIDADESGRIVDMQISPEISRNEKVNYSLGIVVIERLLLINLVRNAASRNLPDLATHVFLKQYRNFEFYIHNITNYTAVIDSMFSYLHSNMDLLREDVRADLFEAGRPVYTKINDTMPVRYGLNAKVKNSLIADGCFIDGTVENSIIFRNVHIENGAVLKNCIIMQGGKIGSDVHMEYVTTDKNVTIKDSHTLMGYDTYPVCISKGSIV